MYTSPSHTCRDIYECDQEMLKRRLKKVCFKCVKIGILNFSVNGLFCLHLDRAQSTVVENLLESLKLEIPSIRNESD
jgi:hypothetical protein